MGCLAFKRHGDAASIPIRKAWHSDWPIVTRSYTRKIEKEKIHNTLLVGSEAAAAATDLAEYWGTVVALNLLFGIPMIYAEYLEL